MSQSFVTESAVQHGGESRAGGSEPPIPGPRRASSLPTWARREMTNLIVENGQLRDQRDRLSHALERLRDSDRVPIRVRRWAEDVLREAADTDGR